MPYEPSFRALATSDPSWAWISANGSPRLQCFPSAGLHENRATAKSRIWLCTCSPPDPWPHIFVMQLQLPGFSRKHNAKQRLLVHLEALHLVLLQRLRALIGRQASSDASKDGKHMPRTSQRFEGRRPTVCFNASIFCRSAFHSSSIVLGTVQACHWGPM